LHSTYLGVSGSMWKDLCGCSELLSCSVVTSKPFYILLMVALNFPGVANEKRYLSESFQVKLKADRCDRSNNYNFKNDGGNNASCCAATGRKLLISPGVADMYTSLMITWNTLLESYQQRVYQNTLTTVKRQILQVEIANACHGHHHGTSTDCQCYSS